MTWVEWITLVALFLGVGVYSFILGWNRGLACGEKGLDELFDAANR
jgi:hypothetical protein